MNHRIRAALAALAVTTHAAAQHELSASQVLDAMPPDATSIAVLDDERLSNPDSPWRDFYSRVFSPDPGPGPVAPLDALLAGVFELRLRTIVAGSEFASPLGDMRPGFCHRSVVRLDQDVHDLPDRVRAAVPAADLTVHPADGITVFEWPHERVIPFEDAVVREPVFVAFPDLRTIVCTESLEDTLSISRRLRAGDAQDPGGWSPLVEPAELDAPAILVRRCGARPVEDGNPPVLCEEPDGVLVMTAPEGALASLTFRFVGKGAPDVYNALINGAFHVTTGDDVCRPDLIRGVRTDDADDEQLPDWAYGYLLDFFGCYVWFW